MPPAPRPDHRALRDKRTEDEQSGQIEQPSHPGQHSHHMQGFDPRIQGRKKISHGNSLNLKMIDRKMMLFVGPVDSGISVNPNFHPQAGRLI